jgi:hypothetical protein
VLATDKEIDEFADRQARCSSRRDDEVAARGYASAVEEARFPFAVGVYFAFIIGAITVMAYLLWREVGAWPVATIAAIVGALTWWQSASLARRARGRNAAEARARRRGGDVPLAQVSRDESGVLREGFLVFHADWIGFFPADTDVDIIIPRSAVMSISAIRDAHWVNRLLRIQYLGERIETLVFHAGPDLSAYCGDAPDEDPELPRATARTKKPEPET